MSTAKVISFYHAKQGVNMDNLKKGYIALTRSIKRAEWAKDAVKRTLWENLLIDASYKSRVVNFKGVDWNLSRGQLVTTREILASQIEIGGKPVSALIIRRALEFFEKQGMISKYGNRLGTVITITNYDAYQSYFFDQSNDQKNNQPHDQCKVNNSKASNSVNDQPCDQSNDQKNDQQNNKVLEQESNNKNNTPISPKGEKSSAENLAKELLAYYNQSRNARCQDYSPFLKVLDKYNLDEIKLVIDWFDAMGKAKAKPQNICRITYFDGYLSDAIKRQESLQTYQNVIDTFNEICGEKLGCVDEITPKRIEKIDSIVKVVSKRNSDFLQAIRSYFEILMETSSDLDICNPKTNWAMNFDNVMTVEKLDNTRSKYMKLQGGCQ